MKENSKTKFGTTHINMIDAVVVFVFAVANLSTTQSLRAWEDLMLVLKSNLQSIRNLQSIAQQNITGYSSQKRSAKSALVEMSAAIMRSVYSFGVKENNLVLAAQMFVSRSDLKGKKYNNLVTYMQGIINIVTPLVPQLTANYNITTQLMEQWQEAVDLLKGLLAGPDNAESNRKSINQDIQQLLHSSMLLLINQADGMVLNFLNNPATVNYYNTYRANRKLKPFGHVPTQLRATTVDDLNQPVECNISIEGTDISGKTVNGYANLSAIPFGEHRVIITTLGDQPQTHTFGPIRFFKGHSLSITFNVQQGFAVPLPQEDTEAANAE